MTRLYVAQELRPTYAAFRSDWTVGIHINPKSTSARFQFNGEPVHRLSNVLLLLAYDG